MNTPLIERLEVNPLDAMGLAAACCYGRKALQSPAKEAKRIAWALGQDPAHLSLGEHARWNFLAPNSYRLATALHQLDKPPRVVETMGDYVLLGCNLSQLRAFRQTGHPCGLRMVELIREQVEPALRDVPLACDYHPARLVEDSELDLVQARVLRTFQFRIVCSRGAATQVNRHRALDGPPDTMEGFEDAVSFSGPETISIEQRSQRYVDEGELGFIWPPGRTEPWPHYEKQISDKYKVLRQRGWTQQDARYMLPNAAETTLIATADCRGWRHFLRLRGEKSAQAEIRFTAFQVHAAISRVCAGLVNDIAICLDELDPWLESQPVEVA